MKTRKSVLNTLAEALQLANTLYGHKSDVTVDIRPRKPNNGKFVVRWKE